MHKGLKGIPDKDSKPDTNQFMSLDIKEPLYKSYLIELGEINRIQIILILNNQSTYHAFIKDDIFRSLPLNKQTAMSFTFIFDD